MTERISDRLYTVAAEHGERPFLVFETLTYCYAEFAGLINAFAAQLLEQGVASSDRVALISGNRPAYLVAWFALTEVGAVTVPINTQLIGRSLTTVLQMADVSLVLLDESLVADHMDDITALGVAVRIIGMPIERPGGGAPRRVSRTAGDPTSLNSILFTSGTSGTPKGAMIADRSFLDAGKDMVRALGISRDERIMVVLPLFHANPQMYAVMSVLEAGATLVLVRNFSASRFFEQAAATKATSFTYVGTILNILLKADVPPSAHSLRWCIGGGAPLEVWTAVAERFDIKVWELYGMTELGGWITLNTPEESRRGSVGRPRDGVEIRILDEDGAALAPGSCGEIVVVSARQQIFFDGYFRNPAASRKMKKGGWFYTGDVGWMDADGYLHFVGRKDDVIRRGGEMVSPTAVELEILEHETIRECGVVGVPDAIYGQEIEAAIVVASGFRIEDFVRYMDANMPKHMRPRYLLCVDRLPKTATEKIVRRSLPDLPGERIDLIGLSLATDSSAMRGRG